MNENIITTLLNNWKNIPIIGRFLILTIIISAIVLTFVFIPSKTLQKVELLTDDVSEDTKNNVISFLKNEQISFSVTGNKIYVSILDKDKALMKLYTANIVPEGPDLYKWVFEMDISETREKRNLKWQITLKKRLEQMLANLENVEWAKVEFTQIQQGPFFELDTVSEPKVSILLKLKNDYPLKRNESLAIAKLVSFALGNVDPKNVTIMDTKRRLYAIPDSQDLLTTEQLQYKLNFEEALEKKVYGLLSTFLNFVTVKANVEIDWKSRISKQTGVDPSRQVVVKEEKEIKKSAANASSGQPGVISKLPVEIPDISSNQTDTVSQSEKKENKVGELEIVENNPAGAVKDVTLAVVVLKEELIKVFSDPKKNKKDDEIIAFGQKQLTDTLSKGVNIPSDKIIVTPVNFLPAKEFAQIIPPTLTPVEEKKIYPQINLIGVIIILATFILASIILLSLKRKRVKLEEIAKTIEKKEIEMKPLTVEEEPLMKEIKQIVKTHPNIASLVIKQWIRGK